MLRLPKISEFFRARKLDIFQRMRMRQIATISGIVVILAFFGVAVATNMFNGGQKTEAANQCLPSATACTISEGVDVGLSTKFDNKDLTITGDLQATFAGHHDFTSLTINNNAKVTIDPLEKGTDYDEITYALTDQGKTKMIDFSIAGKLRINTGGKIDVTGGGYRGGTVFNPQIPNDCADYATCGHGDGPAGGPNDDGHEVNPITGAGGGYGGKGGTGAFIHYIPVPNEYGSVVTFDSSLWNGSGGGAIKRHHPSITWWGDGLPGGGIIKLKVGDIISDGTGSILADGSSNVVEGINYQAGLIAMGGAGAGGTIDISLDEYSGSTILKTVASGGNPCGFIGAGWCSTPEQGVIFTQGDSATSTVSGMTVSANGGTAHHPTADLSGGGGGGGRIFVYAKLGAPPAMQKILKPIERPGLPAAEKANFNPYALREGDIIEVRIDVVDVKQTDTIKDYFLRQPGGTFHCQPIVASLSPDTNHGGQVNTDNVSWSAEADAAIQSFTYRCEVKK